jgi:hypothetical protein
MEDHLLLDTRLARKNQFGRMTPRKCHLSFRPVEEIQYCESVVQNIMMVVVWQQPGSRTLWQFELFAGAIVIET